MLVRARKHGRNLYVSGPVSDSPTAPVLANVQSRLTAVLSMSMDVGGPDLDNMSVMPRGNWLSITDGRVSPSTYIMEVQQVGSSLWSATTKRTRMYQNSVVSKLSGRKGLMYLTER